MYFELNYPFNWHVMYSFNDCTCQEDLGEPLINFAEEIIAAKQNNPDLRFFFHAGETDWQGTSTDINVIDALLVCSYVTIFCKVAFSTNQM